MTGTMDEMIAIVDFDEKSLAEFGWPWGRNQHAALLDAITELKADERCRNLLEAYKEQAIRTLTDVDNPSLKGLLRRIVGKIFNDIEIKGWCSERSAGDAAGRAAGAEAPR